jgi:hypothetical protein
MLFGWKFEGTGQQRRDGRVGCNVRFIGINKDDDHVEAEFGEHLSTGAAEKMAVRSAQQVKPKDEFSTLTPPKTSPLSVSSAAPTRNLENGAYAFERTRSDSSISFWRVAASIEVTPLNSQQSGSEQAD